MIVETLLSSIEQGRQGLNKGLPTGLPKLDSITFGNTRENIILIGADSSAGKSSITTFMSVYSPFMYWLNSDKSHPINWLIFSFEMSASSLFSRLLSMYLWDTYQEIVPFSEIMSLGQVLSEEHYGLIQESVWWLTELEKHVTIIDKPVTAKAMYGIIKEWSRKFGDYKEIERTSDYVKEDYVPKDSEQYCFVIVDHVKLFATQTGHTTKQEIDEACTYLIHFRDKCKMTIYMVQQLNRGFKDMARRTEGGGQFADIQLNDFQDTAATQQAANNVLAIFYPYREHLSRWKEYLVDPKKGGLGSVLRTISILKNREGTSDKAIGVGFYGECHQWKELPLPSEIKDYEPYTHL